MINHSTTLLITFVFPYIPVPPLPVFLPKSKHETSPIALPSPPHLPHALREPSGVPSAALGQGRHNRRPPTGAHLVERLDQPLHMGARHMRPLPLPRNRLGPLGAQPLRHALAGPRPPALPLEALRRRQPALREHPQRARELGELKINEPIV
jgi:hypothetical protein